MSLRARAALAATALLVLPVAACAPGASQPDYPGGPSRSNVDVDTPELRTLKEQAGIEPCAPGSATDSALPAITLPCLGGGPDVDLSTLRGPMVVNLWYATCGPCRQEMPALQAFHEQHGDQVAVLGIDYQDTVPGVALELARETGARYPQLADPGGDVNGLAPFPPVSTLPYLGFVDERGEIVGHEFGGIESPDELVALVREHLGVEL